jgi:AcrR family transcriptional regulator
LTLDDHGTKVGRPSKLPPEVPLARRTVQHERREQILEAVFQAAAQGGIAGASVSEIAERAGVARGAIHYFFANKDDVTTSLMRSLGDRYLAGLSAYLDRVIVRDLERTNGSDRMDAVRALVRFHFDHKGTDVDKLLTVWIDFWGQAASKPAIGDVVRTVQNTARGLCLRALRHARPELAHVDDEALRHTAATLLAVIEGGLLQWRIGLGSETALHRTELCGAIANMAIAAVRALPDTRTSTTTATVSALPFSVRAEAS